MMNFGNPTSGGSMETRAHSWKEGEFINLDSAANRAGQATNAEILNSLF
jgi:hypothetical protein